jgi:hypothetical protein
MKAIPCLVMLLLAAACAKDQPRRVQNENLGIAATFPGEARLSKREEDTPFGPILWFETAFVPTSRLDESFYITVGNLPKGTAGGVTPGEVLATFQKWLNSQMGPVQRSAIPPEKGPGFRYSRALPGRWTEGIAVVRQGRLYHAQATVRNSADARVKTFLDSFEVK